ncbi:MAG TPA: hypothetical protein VFC85_09510 [Verrucomicrobiae bacterium]|nr:hypothetical protein [Verrucomicrobiae bacterium]
MTTGKKKFWSVIFIILVLVIVAAVIVALNLDRIVKREVKIYGPQITKVSVTLDNLHISLLAGSATVNGFVLGNPEGYKTPDAISIGHASVGINPFSLLTDKIVVHSIHVTAPEITFEGGLGGNNLSKIMDNVNGSSQTGGPVVTNSAGQPKASKKIEVDDFLITNALVHVSLTGNLGAVVSREMTLTIPAIHLTNLGKGTDGLTATEMTRAILSAITSATVKAVAANATNLGGKGAQLIKQRGQGTLNQATKTIGNLFK